MIPSRVKTKGTGLITSKIDKRFSKYPTVSKEI